jgi:hypothetical protein
VVVIGANAARLDGFVITGPDGGMRNEAVTVTIANTRFEGCEEGAMDNRGADVSIVDSSFAGNAGYEGAAVYAEDSTLVLQGVAFEANEAEFDGGAVSVHESTVTMTDVTMLDNAAERSGGGLAANEGELDLRRVHIEGNHANWQGGGIYDGQNESMYVDVTLRENASGNDGGGAYLWFTTVLVTNSSFERNSASSRGSAVGGGASDGNFTNVSFSANFAVGGGSGPAFDGAGEFAVVNAVFWGHADGDVTSGLVDVSYSCAASELYGDTNVVLASSPFVDGDDGQLWIDAASPCVDAGDSAAADLAFGLAELDWTAMGTDPSGATDTGVVDAGRHY